MKHRYPQKKLSIVWIDTWLSKYIRTVADFTPENELIVKGSILIPTDTDRKKSRPVQYFQKAQGKSRLKILTRQSDLNKLYGLMRLYRQWFYRDMIQYAAARHGIMFVQTALREFLRKKEIYESDYSTEAAYKKWQRSKEYEELKGTSIFDGQANLELYHKVKAILENERNQQQLHG